MKKELNIIPPRIVGLSCKLGSQSITIEEIAKHFSCTTEEIQKKSGITKLYSISSKETFVDLIVNTILSILKHVHKDVHEITGIFGSSNPTGETLIPTLTVAVAAKLGLKNVIADHIGLGCCGGLQTLRNAYNQIIVDSLNNKISYYIVFAADNTNRILDSNDVSTAILFSEGCGAILLTNDVNNYPDALSIQNIHTKSLLTDQRSIEAIRLKNPYVYGKTASLSMVEINGSIIYKFGTNIMNHIMECAGTSLDVFKQENMYLIPHQPNLRMLQSLMEKNELTKSQMYIDGIKTIGNTSGPATFFGLHDVLSRNLLNTTKKIILGAFGAELQVGATMLVPLGDSKSIIC